MSTVRIHDYLLSKRADKKAEPEEEMESSEGGADGASRDAWKASAAAPIKEHVAAHRMAAEKHEVAAKAQKEAGNMHAAHAHEMAAKDHCDCADDMDKKYSDSHLYGVKG